MRFKEIIQVVNQQVLPQKQFKPSQFYSKLREPQLVPGTNGSLKPETDCNYCKDLGHLKIQLSKTQGKRSKNGRASKLQQI